MASASKLAELLVQGGLIDGAQLQSALGQQRQWGGRLGRILVEMKFTNGEAIANLLAQKTGVKRVDLATVAPDHAALKRLDGLYCDDKLVYPCAIRDNGHTLWIAVEDPTDVALADEVAARAGLRVRTVVAPVEQIEEALGRAYPDVANRHKQKQTMYGTRRQVEDSDADVEAGAFKITDIHGNTVMKSFDELKAAHEAQQAAKGPAEPDRPEWSAELQQQLEKIQENQRKGTLVLRALIELCVEKKVFSMPEYRGKIAK